MATPKGKAKTRPKTRLEKQPHGGALKRGNTVNVGRPANEFMAMCRELVTRDATWQAVQAILAVKDHPHYMSALKWAAEHGYGKPKESLDVNMSGEVTVKQEWTFGKKTVGF